MNIYGKLAWVSTRFILKAVQDDQKLKIIKLGVSTTDAQNLIIKMSENNKKLFIYVTERYVCIKPLKKKKKKKKKKT